MNEDWFGWIGDPVCLVRFNAAIMRLSEFGVTKVTSIKTWPPRTIGVINGQLCMSQDMCDEARSNLGEIHPESN